jgi:hypothetical protein
MSKVYDGTGAPLNLWKTQLPHCLSFRLFHT